MEKLDLEALRRFKPRRDRELPLTGVEVSGPRESPVYRPIFGSGSLGTEEPALGALLEKKALGSVMNIIWGSGTTRVVPWWGDEKLTPYGATAYPSPDETLRDYDEEWNLTQAALAEQRRLSQGHYGYYDHAWIRGMIANEGLEYGVTGYTAIENYVEDARPLAYALREACAARDAYANGESPEWEDVPEGQEPTGYEERLSQLARAAESAKQNLCNYLGIANEPWEGPR